MRVLTRVLFNTVFVLAAALAWPIYQTPQFLVLVVVSLVLANAISLLAAARKLSPSRIALITLGSYLLLGIPLAIPSALTNPSTLGSALGQLFVAPITGWRDLLTLSLPVGSYQAVLIPAFIVFFVAPVAALTVADAAIAPAASSTSSARRVTALPLTASLIALVPMLFALLFGSSFTSPPLVVLAGSIPAPQEIAATLASVLLLAVWMLLQRHRVGSTGVRPLPALAQTLAALAVGVLLAPLLLSSTPREVPRTQIDPEVVLQAEVTPLSVYRNAFSNELFNAELFAVSPDTSLTQMRLATLSGFDGQYATIDSGGINDEFSRVPAIVSAPTGDDATTVRIAALRDIYLPTPAGLSALSFTSNRATALSDGFFYSRGLSAGIELAGLDAGDSYRVTSSGESFAALAELAPGLTESRFDPAVVPASLQDWVALQRLPRSGEGLAEAIDRLRARGYLSHALSIDPANPPEWMLDLGAYAFEPSRAGHSSARIDQLFTQLLDRQREVGDAEDAELVAAPGDDEQFAVAAMLLADQFGFNARVVLGTQLDRCKAGACEGGNLAAWLEVQGESGQWATVEVTPQHEVPLAPNVERLQDPENVTEVLPPSADPIEPPNSGEGTGDGADDDRNALPLDLRWLLQLLRVMGVVLLLAALILGPAVLVLWLKRRRRQRRRENPDPRAAALGAWHEYVDAFVDRGAKPSRLLTRTELVHQLSPERPEAAAQFDLRIARLADRAVFDVTAPDEAEVTQAWAAVDARLREIDASTSRTKTWRAHVSPRSLLTRLLK